MAEFDPILQEHLRRYGEGQKKIHYINHSIQDELLYEMSNLTTNLIVGKVKEAKYFAIIMDCTPDISHKEQLSIIVCFLSFHTKNRSFEIEESFFVFFLGLDDKTSKGITEIFQETMAKHGLDINHSDTEKECKHELYV